MTENENQIIRNTQLLGEAIITMKKIKEHLDNKKENGSKGLDHYETPILSEINSFLKECG